jgi:GAF domain-containing protein
MWGRANLCRVPIALVSLVDDDRQWFKAQCGLDGVTSTGRDLSFCAHAILQQGIFEIPDTLDDPRFADNPLVTGAPFMRYYAGVPLIERGGMPLGTLCVIDRKPRRLIKRQRQQLEDLAASVVGLILMRIRGSELEAFRRSRAENAGACQRLREHTAQFKTLAKRKHRSLRPIIT